MEHNQTVAKYDRNGAFVKEYSSIEEASVQSMIPKNKITFSDKQCEITYGVYFRIFTTGIKPPSKIDVRPSKSALRRSNYLNINHRRSKQAMGRKDKSNVGILRLAKGNEEEKYFPDMETALKDYPHGTPLHIEKAIADETMAFGYRWAYSNGKPTYTK